MDSSAETVIIMNNNFIDCQKPIIDVSQTKYTDQKSINCTSNYWGPVNTEELNLVGANNDVSFIIDYYDNLESTKVDYSNWSTSEFVEAGYKGDAFDWTTLSQ